MFLNAQAVIQVVFPGSQKVTFPCSRTKIRVVSSRRWNRENLFLDFLDSGLVGMTVKTAVPGQSGHRQACLGRRSG